MIKTIYRKTSDTSRAPDRRRAPHTGRGSDSLVQIEAGASIRGFMVTGKNYSLSLYIQTTKEPKTAAGSELIARPGFILCVPWLAVECPFCYSDKLQSKVHQYHWCGLRPSVLGQDQSQTKKSVLVLVLVLLVWCCVVKHGLVTLVVIMSLNDTATFQVQ